MTDQHEAVQTLINNAKASAVYAFFCAMDKFDGHVYELQDMSKDHMGTTDDEILWEATNMVNRYNALLAQVTDHFHKRGEYAK